MTMNIFDPNWIDLNFVLRDTVLNAENRVRRDRFFVLMENARGFPTFHAAHVQTIHILSKAIRVAHA